MAALTECLKRYLLAQRVVLPGMVVTIVTALAAPLYFWLLTARAWQLGLLGAARAFVLSQGTGAALLLGYTLWRDAARAGTPDATWPRPGAAVLAGWGTYLSYGLPAAAMICMEWWCYEVVIFMAGGRPGPAPRPARCAEARPAVVVVRASAMAEGGVVYQCVRGTDIKARYRVVSQNVPKYAEQTFYGTVLARTDLNAFQSHLELMWDGFDDPEVVMVHWIEPSAYDPEKAIMGLAPLYRAKAEPKLGEIIDLPEYPDCEWHTSAHVIINLRMLGGVPSYTVWALAHSKEMEVDHVRFNASYKAMQFDPELLQDQRRRGWGDRQLTMLGIEQRPDGALLVVVVVERIDGKLLRFVIPGMGGREDWGRSEEELMRARGVVDEVLVSLSLAPAHYDENLRARLYGGVPNLMAVRQWVKAQIMQQCQGQVPRLKPDLPPQAWGVAFGGGRGRGRGRGRGGGRKRRGDSSDEDEPEPDPESDSEPDEEYTASGRPKRKRKTKSKMPGGIMPGRGVMMAPGQMMMGGPLGPRGGPMMGGPGMRPPMMGGVPIALPGGLNLLGGGGMMGGPGGGMDPGQQLLQQQLLLQQNPALMQAILQRQQQAGGAPPGSAAMPGP
ncbi:Slc47a1 [Scenedesmus sp. PABB004]|nr:Slc47a1 [Scenedesmus sp. PABB004]